MGIVDGIILLICWVTGFALAVYGVFKWKTAEQDLKRFVVNSKCTCQYNRAGEHFQCERCKLMAKYKWWQEGQDGEH